MEAKETVEDNLLSQVANVLKVPEDAIKNFNEQAYGNVFNTFNNNNFSNSSSTFHATHCIFNPIEKWFEVIEENKKLYERLLTSVNRRRWSFEKQELRVWKTKLTTDLTATGWPVNY